MSPERWLILFPLILMLVATLPGYLAVSAEGAKIVSMRVEEVEGNETASVKVTVIVEVEPDDIDAYAVRIRRGGETVASSYFYGVGPVKTRRFIALSFERPLKEPGKYVYVVELVVKKGSKIEVVEERQLIYNVFVVKEEGNQTVTNTTASTTTQPSTTATTTIGNASEGAATQSLPENGTSKSTGTVTVTVTVPSIASRPTARTFTVTRTETVTTTLFKTETLFNTIVVTSTVEKIVKTEWSEVLPHALVAVAAISGVVILILRLGRARSV